jgi:hypothetical protein
MAHALITGVKDEVAHFKRPVAPLLQLGVQLLGCAADLRSPQPLFCKQR